MRAARFVVYAFLILALLGWGGSLLEFMRLDGSLATPLMQLLNALAYLVALACFRSGSRRLCALMVMMGTGASVGLHVIDLHWMNLRLALVDSLPALFSWICAGCFGFLYATRDHPSLEAKPSPRYAVDDPE